MLTIPAVGLPYGPFDWTLILSPYYAQATSATGPSTIVRLDAPALLTILGPTVLVMAGLVLAGPMLAVMARLRVHPVHHPAFPIAGGLLALLVYLGIAWFVLPPQALWSPDEGAKLLQLQNLRLDNGRLAYDITYPGRALDPDLQFAQIHPSHGLLRIRDHAMFFQRLPLFPLLVLPLFRWFGFFGLYLLPAIGGAFIGVLALGLLERRDRRFAMWILIAFGSPVLIYATIFWEHTVATSLGLAGAWLALRIHPIGRAAPLRTILGWIAVGIVLGIGVYIRLEIVLFAVALLMAYWVVVREGRWGPLWAGASLGLTTLPYVPLHQAMFGQGVPDNARYLFYPFLYLRRARWHAVPDLLIGPFRDGAIDPGFLGELWAVAAVMALAYSFGSLNSSVARTLRLIGLGITAVVGAIFLFTSSPYRSAHGLLFTTPWALLGLCRAHEIWQRGDRRARIVVLSTILGLVVYVVGLIGLRASSPHGGLEWGARFALTFYPLLALMAAWDLGSKRRDVKTLVVTGALMFLGVGFQTRGILTLRHDKQINFTLNQALAESPEHYVVSDLPWMPLNAAPIYTQKAIFVAPTPKRIGDWVNLAADHQTPGFYLVTLNNALIYDVARTLDEHSLRTIDIRHVENLSIFHMVAEPR
ncbi:MAG: hypothetical protein ACE5LU_08520 [Anaerolineae bacterium]